MDDPGTAMEWFIENRDKHPRLLSDYMLGWLVAAAAPEDMKLVFDHLGGLGAENPGEILGRMAIVPKNEGERTAFLMNLREYRSRNPDGQGNDIPSEALGGLAFGIQKGGFEAGSRWIAENNFSEKEMMDLAGTIASSGNAEGNGKWIEWMGGKLSENNRDDWVGSTMENWTRQDYRAAGEWLAQAPGGAVRSAAVSAYAKTVAPYDPQAAAQWALTLLPGERRAETLNAIYEGWPQGSQQDKAERAAFMAEHPAH